MARTAKTGRSAPAKEGLSEIRTTVLGPQILLGFQYQAVFQPGFAAFEPWRKALELAALGLLLVTIALVMSSASFHQIAERGQRDARQVGYTKRVLEISLASFGVAIAVALVVATASELGVVGATIAAVCAAVVVFLLWYGVELMVKRPQSKAAPAAARTNLKDKLEDVMTETRIALPGVQALLGFQFAAYLAPAFGKLPSDARAAHDGALVLLLLSMALLMTPAPFHRIAEQGQDTERAHEVGGGLILAAMASLAFGLAGDLFVAARACGLSAGASGAAFALAVAVLLAAWFIAPTAFRASAAPSARSR